MTERKRLALVAHDNCKADLIEWVNAHWQRLAGHHLTCTGTTGKLVSDLIHTRQGTEPQNMRRLKSGPLGGDQQLGALIAEEKIDAIFFFWDPMYAQPHDVDVKALLRICVLYNVVTACNRSTADFVISSPFFDSTYARRVPEFGTYTGREISLK